MEEARRAVKMAEKKLWQNDYNGAKKFINKAKKFYPKLDGLEQVLMMVNVYISASNKINGEADWYGVLGVDLLADDETVKKQYKRLALLLHPDKNKFIGSEGAFKLVLEAWCVLSDKVKRSCYDQIRRKSKEAKKEMQKPHKPGSSNPSAMDSSKQRKDSSWFWKKCNNCSTEEYLSDYYLNKSKFCRNCHQNFIVTEKNPVKGSSSTPQPQGSKENKEPNRSNNGASSSVRSTPQATNKKISGASSQQEQSQWISQNKSGGTYSKKIFASSVSFTFNRSVKSTTQGQGISKREHEKSQDKVDDDAERSLKKPRTDVR
ncbi:Chaperone protein dnaJ 49 [Cardamine amara subsp. amara]|uniref:Chaperone protein dnaJ 49 n=1 Tax=Cardamine amara subsp. amara TaxID=228776 RepID=A0ABD1A0E8_CARAN